MYSFRGDLPFAPCEMLLGPFVFTFKYGPHMPKGKSIRINCYLSSLYLKI